jgi:hypothetical protein
MTLTPDQKQAVSTWISAGDNLSAVQKKLSEQFKISMTYRDVRFLVDDLGLELKNAAPKADASDVTKAPQPKAAIAPAQKPALPGEPEADEGSADAGEANLPADGEGALPEDGAEDLADTPAGPGGVTLELDRIMRPGTAVSGSVTFSDGVSGKWALDQYGRLMLDTGQKGYQPSAPDVQAFQRELQAQLQRQGY